MARTNDAYDAGEAAGSQREGTIETTQTGVVGREDIADRSGVEGPAGTPDTSGVVGGVAKPDATGLAGAGERADRTGLVGNTTATPDENAG
ncbi:MAG TPA: hypothetical protein VFU88_11305 [Ktedonobacterales bacterium]|nr:hypothetical protein [Ktedonobacterales bacterium]